MVTQAEVLRFNRAQGQVIAAASSDLSGLFGSLDLARPESARDALLEGYPALAGQYGDLSSTVAAEWYEDARRNERGGAFAALLAAPVAVERLEGTVRWAAGALFEDDPRQAASLLGGSLDRVLGDAARDTINENVRNDPQAVGWHRIARSDGCDFCVMLSQRGAVYKRATADFASHDNCRCTVAPSWDPSAPEVDVRAYEASDRMESVRRRANDPELPARDRARAQGVLDRHRKRTREWMDAQSWRLDDFRAELY